MSVDPGGQGDVQRERRCRDLFPSLIRQNLWPYPMLGNPTCIRACPRPSSPDPVNGTRDNRGTSMKLRVLSLLQHRPPPANTSHHEPSRWEDPAPIPTSQPPLSTIEKSHPDQGPPQYPIWLKDIWDLGWAGRIGAKGDGEVVLLLNRRASTAQAASPCTSINWRAAAPTRAGIGG